MVCVVYDLTQGDSLDRVRDDLTTLYPFIPPPPSFVATGDQLLASSDQAVLSGF